MGVSVGAGCVIFAACVYVSVCVFSCPCRAELENALGSVD
jgi:hypothetical protein